MENAAKVQSLGTIQIVFASTFPLGKCNGFFCLVVWPRIDVSVL